MSMTSQPNFIGGRRVPSTGGPPIDVIDPTTESVIGSVASSTLDDVDAAVRAAIDGFMVWSATGVDERVEMLARIVASLRERSDSLARLISREVGSPLAYRQSGIGREFGRYGLEEYLEVEDAPTLRGVSR